MNKIKLLIVAGPTASGKSDLAMEIAGNFGGEIVSADSLQVYRYMDIGTAKPTPEGRERVVHHLLDVVTPDEEFTAGIFRELASDIIGRLHEKGEKALLVGGTGLYIKALTKGLFDSPLENGEMAGEVRGALRNEMEMCDVGTLYKRLEEVDPEAALNIHPQNRQRISRALEVYDTTTTPISTLQRGHGFNDEPYDTLYIGLSWERDALYERIDKRVEGMMEKGLVEEVKSLIERGYGPHLKPMQGLGYKEVVKYIAGELSLDEAIERIKRDTRRYAKRQYTWFRKEGPVKWVSSTDEAFGLIENFYR